MLLKVLGSKNQTIDSAHLDAVGIRYNGNMCTVVGVGRQTYTLLETTDESVARKLMDEANN